MVAIQRAKRAKKLLIIGVLTATMIVPSGMALADEGEIGTQDALGLDTITVEDQYGIVPASVEDVYLRLDLDTGNTTAGTELGSKETDSGVYLKVWDASLSDSWRVNLYGIGWRWNGSSWINADCTVGIPQLRWNGKHTFRQNIYEWGYSHAQITAWRNTAPAQILYGVWSPDYEWDSGVTNL